MSCLAMALAGYKIGVPSVMPPRDDPYQNTCLNMTKFTCDETPAGMVCAWCASERKCKSKKEHCGHGHKSAPTVTATPGTLNAYLVANHGYQCANGDYFHDYLRRFDVCLPSTDPSASPTPCGGARSQCKYRMV